MMAANPSMHALVVGANENTTANLASFLKRWGYNAFCVDSGEAALAEAPRLNPDLVFIGSSLRETAGRQLPRRLRELSSLSSTPLVAIGSVATEADDETVRSADYDDHLSDTFTLADLAALMDRLKRKIVAARNRIEWSRNVTARAQRLTAASRGALDEFWRARIDAQPRAVYLLGGDDATLKAVAAGRAASLPVARFESLDRLLDDLASNVNGSGGCVIFDATLPAANAIATVRQLADHQPRVSVIVLVADYDVSLAVRSVRAGAFDVIEKSHVQEKLSAVIAAAIEDHRFAAGATEAVGGQLSDAERRLLTLTAQGMLNKQIARELEVCLRTVHIRRAELMKKLRIASRTELIRFAVEAGLLR